MSAIRRSAAGGAVLIATLLVTGCYDDPDVTLYEPGVYKGSPDPLLELQRSAKQQQELQERFSRVQTDR